jgi:glutamyl-tRNA reductase
MQATSVLSLSWREGGPELLALCTATVEERPALLSRLASELDAEEVLYLVTCNRVEIAYRSSTPLSADEARRAILAAVQPESPIEPRAWRAWTGEGAVEHLFLVAAGLASAKVGETEIAGQLRDSLALSRDLGLSGGPLADFVDEALRTSRRIRQETSLSEGRTSLAEIALDRLREHQEATSGPFKVALIGRSAMTQRCARSLFTDGAELHWANRTPDNLQPHADEVHATVHSLESFQADPPQVHAIVTATGATQPIFDAGALARLANAGAGLIVDLSVSPDICSSEAATAGMSHLCLQEILERADQTKSEKGAAAADARVLVDEALELLSSRHRARSAGQAASKLHERFRHDAALATEDALKKEFKHLPDDDAEKLRRFSDLLARRLAHNPAKGLRRLAADHGPKAADNFLEGSNPKEEPQ